MARSLATSGWSGMREAPGSRASTAAAACSLRHALAACHDRETTPTPTQRKAAKPPAATSSTHTTAIAATAKNVIASMTQDARGAARASVRCRTHRPRACARLPAIADAFLVAVVPAPALRIGAPAAEIRGRLAIAAHGNAQHEQRHVLPFHGPPRPVVPAVHVPRVFPVHPVHAVVEEVIRVRPRVVIDGVTRTSSSENAMSGWRMFIPLVARAGARGTYPRGRPWSLRNTWSQTALVTP